MILFYFNLVWSMLSLEGAPGAATPYPGWLLLPEARLHSVQPQGWCCSSIPASLGFGTYSAEHKWEFQAVPSWALGLNPLAGCWECEAAWGWRWGREHFGSSLWTFWQLSLPTLLSCPQTRPPHCCSSLPWRAWLPLSAELHCTSRPHRLLLCPIINMKLTYSCLPKTWQRLQTSPLCWRITSTEVLFS